MSLLRARSIVTSKHKGDTFMLVLYIPLSQHLVTIRQIFRKWCQFNSIINASRSISRNEYGKRIQMRIYGVIICICRHLSRLIFFKFLTSGE